MIGEGFDSVLAGAQAGDPRALETLYDDLAPVVLGYARGHGAPEPEDLASEVFVSIVRNLGRFCGDEIGFRSWVFTIVHRRLVDERRRSSRRREAPVDPLALRSVVLEEPAGQDAELERIHVRRLLELLTPDQRSVLLLRVVADLPVAEVARILGKTEGAVKTLQRRALASLARRMQKEPVS